LEGDGGDDSVAVDAGAVGEADGVHAAALGFDGADDRVVADTAAQSPDGAREWFGDRRDAVGKMVRALAREIQGGAAVGEVGVGGVGLGGDEQLGVDEGAQRRRHRPRHDRRHVAPER